MKTAKKAAPSGKLDLYKKHRGEYVAPAEPVVVTVGPARYLAIDGQGEPGGEAFTACVGALYSVAYTVKMASKHAGRDYGVCKLEGLWWAGRSGCDYSAPRSEWRWKLMIRTPDFVTAAQLGEAVKRLRAGEYPPEVEKVRLETIKEGRCVQMLHVGPYDQEPKTVARMLEFAQGQGVSVKGPHHEIYLSDPRRVAPARLRTILRHPVRAR